MPMSQSGQVGQEFWESRESPGGGNVPWTWPENEAIWSHPDWTAAELAEIIPRHSVKAIKRHRSRIGRYRPDVTPLCQKCGEHPVWVAAADARRWGLCRACALDERDWLLRHGRELDRRDNALRQAKFKRRRREGGGPVA